MNFLWPSVMLLLGLIPLLTLLYIWMIRRKRKFVVRYSSLSLVRAALPKHSKVHRHLPFALFMIAMASLITAASRPVKIVAVPSARTTVILAIDVSLSMCATDIEPSRLRVAKDAALSFIQNQDNNIQIGVVAFAGFAAVSQAPTTERAALERAIENLEPGRRTAIGSAILKSIDAIAEVDSSVSRSVASSTEDVATPVPEGTYAPAIIVLLTDGVSNTGMQPEDAALQAIRRGLRVYTIGFGTRSGQGASLNCANSPSEVHTPLLGEGKNPQSFSSSWQFPRGIDEATLTSVAEKTGGKYYSAESANELQKIFQELPVNYVFKQEKQEVTVAFTAFAALLTTLAVVLSLIWHSIP